MCIYIFMCTYVWMYFVIYTYSFMYIYTYVEIMSIYDFNLTKQNMFKHTVYIHLSTCMFIWIFKLLNIKGGIFMQQWNFNAMENITIITI